MKRKTCSGCVHTKKPIYAKPCTSCFFGGWTSEWGSWSRQNIQDDYSLHVSDQDTETPEPGRVLINITPRVWQDEDGDWKAEVEKLGIKTRSRTREKALHRAQKKVLQKCLMDLKNMTGTF